MGNASLNKQLSNENINIALELFVHGLQFYLKLISNYTMILDSVRGFENQLVKTNQVEELYENLFAFLKCSLNKNVSTDVSKNRTKTENTKFGYLFKFYISLFMQYVNVCFNAHLKKGKDMLINELKCIQHYFKKDRFIEYKSDCTKKELDELKYSSKLFDIIELILKYTDRFEKL